MISQVRIPDEVKFVAGTLEKAGYEAYLVGGCVRDLLLDKPPKDWDLTTNAHPEQIQALFPEHYANNDFGTVGVKTDAEDETIKIIEITPYRSESGYTDLRRPDRVAFGVSLEEDLARRDFTVNALAYRIATDTTVDLFGGIEDLRAKRLKAVGDAHERFNEDALRMMRAVRLSAELGFVVDSTMTKAITENNELLKRISVERVSAEFLRIINSVEPMRGIIFLHTFGLLQHIVPELVEGVGCEQGGIHAFD
ncbi:MAG: hypothetical protein KBB78_04105, partial [Candidatus Pacebacteria bacterium]|nr:hypothetical protein [Candidatus Paceibacterota bacterium]